VTDVKVQAWEGTVQIPILIEPLEGDRFRARAGAPFELSVEATTKDEAVRLLQARINEQLASGAEIQVLSVETPIPRAALVCGLAKDFPDWDQFLQAVEAFRQQEDAQEP
jgi:hypothetical protein